MLLCLNWEHIVDKLFVAILGIASALITDLLIKRRRERKKNVDEGKNYIKEACHKRLSDFKNSGNISLPINSDFIDYLSKKKINISEIEKRINESFETKVEAVKEFESIKKLLKIE